MATVGAKYQGNSCCASKHNLVLEDVYVFKLPHFWGSLCILDVNSKSILLDLFGSHLSFIFYITEEFGIAKKGLLKCEAVCKG